MERGSHSWIPQQSQWHTVQGVTRAVEDNNLNHNTTKKRKNDGLIFFAHVLSSVVTADRLSLLNAEETEFDHGS